jgi:hypothetical protein
MKSHDQLVIILLLIFSAPVFGQGITFTNCAEFPVCLPFNNCTQMTATVTAAATTTCFDQSLNFTYKVDLGNNGSFEAQDLGNTVTQNFPVGLSRISWRATSNCGHIATCEQIVNVRDCTGPNLICRNGITQSLDANCTMVVNAQQFVLSISDNCTPTNQIQYGLRRAGTGTGFPTKDTIQYAICDQGTNIVEMWVRDAAGNTNQCSNYVLVQNNSNACPCISSTDVKLKGCNRTVQNGKLSTYRMSAKANGTAPGSPAVNTTKVQSFQDSCYTLDVNGLPVNFTGTITVSASRFDLVTTGVTPYDLVLISRHILNLEPMTTIYQVLAADVNRSQTVTNFDIVEIRKTLLGTLDTLPKVGAWQFIRPVPNPLEMLNFAAVKDTFRLAYNNVSGAQNNNGLNFIGIKSADLDYTASLTGHDVSSDRHGADLLFSANDTWLEAGQSVNVPVLLSESVDLSAWQLNVRAHADKARITGVTGLPDDAWALQPDGSVRMLWMDEIPGSARHFEVGQELANVQVTAQTAGWLSQMLEPLPDVPAEAITDKVMIRPVQFHFTVPPTTGGTTVYQPVPNPAHDQVQWPLLLEQPGDVRLELVSASGQVVMTQNTRLDAGYQRLTAHLDQLAPGWYAWRIIAGNHAQTGTLLRH